jgi:hypothetical protein
MSTHATTEYQIVLMRLDGRIVTFHADAPDYAGAAQAAEVYRVGMHAEVMRIARVETTE